MANSLCLEQIASTKQSKCLY